jgi:hypothetical protein
VFLTRGAGFYNYSHETEKIPLHSYPICCQWVGQAFWTQWQLNFSKKVPKQPPASPGYIIYSNLLELELGKVASNGSVHLLQQTVATAWIVVSGTEYCMSACYLIANISLVSSYRSELNGIFWSLKHLKYLNITPQKV